MNILETLFYLQFRLQLMYPCHECGQSVAESDGRCPLCRSLQRLTWEANHLPIPLKDWALSKTREWCSILQDEKFKFVVAQEEHQKATAAAACKVAPGPAKTTTPNRGVGAEAEEAKTEKEEGRETSPRRARSSRKKRSRSPEAKEKDRRKKSKSKKKKKDHKEKRHRRETSRTEDTRSREKPPEVVNIKEEESESSEKKGNRGVKEVARGSQEKEPEEKEEEERDERSPVTRRPVERRESHRERPREPSYPPPRRWDRRQTGRQHHRFDHRNVIGSNQYQGKTWTNRGRTKVEKQRAYNAKIGRKGI